MTLFQHPNSIPNKIIHLLNSSITPTQLHQIQAQILLQNLHLDTSVFFLFINACKSSGLLDSALSIFNQIPIPHVFICNNLIKSFSHSNSPHNSIFIYSQMHRNSIPPNNFTFPFILKSLSDLCLLKHGQAVHVHVIKTGHSKDIYVQNSLMDLYSSCGALGTCERMFEEMPQRDVVSWTTLISSHRNTGRLDKALKVSQRMRFSGVEPNRVTMVNVLAACAGRGALEMGVWVHDYIKRNGWELDVTLGTSLVDMYGKCGKIEMGLSVFESMLEKDVFTWNSLIGGLALAKNGEEAVSRFFKMQEEGIKPDHVSLIVVLVACSHSGMVDVGRQIFNSIINGRYGFLPGIKHYGCMIDLLGRSGLIVEARYLIEKMPFEPSRVMWGALLNGSRGCGDLNAREFALTRLVELEPGNGAYYVLLSNLYAEMGRWRDVEKVRGLMKERGVKKDLGSSTVEVEQPRMRVYELLQP